MSLAPVNTAEIRCVCCSEKLSNPKYVRRLSGRAHCLECFKELRDGVLPAVWRLRLIRDDAPPDLNALVAACRRPKIGLLSS